MASTDAITFPAKSHTHSEYAAKSHTHAYLPTTGGTMTGRITKAGTSSSWQKGRDNAAFFVNSVSGYSPAYSLKTPNGSWEIGNYNTAGYENQLLFSYVTDTNYNGTNATNTQFRMRPDGYITGNITGSSGSCTGNSASASKVNNSLTIRLNGGTTEGSNQFTFNGSAAKTLSITASNIGAAASSHTHSYAGSASAGGPASKVRVTNQGGISAGTYAGANGMYLESQSGSAARPQIAFHHPGNNGCTLYYDNSNFFAFCMANSGTTYTLNQTAGSDERVKENFIDIDYNKYKNFILSLHPYQFQYKLDRQDDNEYHYGFKAQEVERELNKIDDKKNCIIFKNQVFGLEKEFVTDEFKYNIRYEEFVPILTCMIQECIKRLDKIEEKVPM